MQIHELSRKRRTDEGIMDVVKGVGKAAATGLGHAVAAGAGYDLSKNTTAKSAGILDPAQKLAAVMKEPQMVKLATQYADEWVKSIPSPLQQAQPAPQTAPQTAPAGETPEQKRIRLQKAAQQNIDKTAVPAPTKTAAPTPADIRQVKQAQAAQAAQAQMSAVKEDTAVATPGTYNKKTGAAKLGGKTMTALSDLPPAVQQQIQAKQDLEQQTGRPNPYTTPAAQQPAPTATQTTAPAKTTGTTMPITPYQTPGAGTNPNPTTQTKPQIPASIPSDYINNFEAWANQKIAMRDPTTYRTIALADVKNTTNKENLKTEIEKAKQEVIKAQGDPAATKEAVKNYILTALAAGQLIASQNRVASASTQAPAYGQQGTAQPSATRPAADQSNSASQGQPIDIQALIKNAGLDATALQKAAAVMQKATRNNKLRATGDDAIDGMLELMGYKVS